MQPKVTRFVGESYANRPLLREAFVVKYKTFYVCLMHRNAVDCSPSIRRFVTIVPEVFPLCLANYFLRTFLHPFSLMVSFRLNTKFWLS
jgi:hypothetical protein